MSVDAETILWEKMQRVKAQAAAIELSKQTPMTEAERADFEERLDRLYDIAEAACAEANKRIRKEFRALGLPVHAAPRMFVGPPVPVH